jgi:hypothetical protein
VDRVVEIGRSIGNQRRSLAGTCRFSWFSSGLRPTVPFPLDVIKPAGARWLASPIGANV